MYDVLKAAKRDNQCANAMPTSSMYTNMFLPSLCPEAYILHFVCCFGCNYDGHGLFLGTGLEDGVGTAAPPPFLHCFVFGWCGDVGEGVLHLVGGMMNSRG